MYQHPNASTESDNFYYEWKTFKKNMVTRPVMITDFAGQYIVPQNIADNVIVNFFF